MVPVVAIVGRPNVGKSALFNKLIGRRVSIVSDFSGVTRDRIEGDISWNGRKIRIVDTGGLSCAFEHTKDLDVMASSVHNQVKLAVSFASVIVFVVDVKVGLTQLDEEIALTLKKMQRPVVLCVNKCDSTGELDAGVYEFYKLGFSGEPIGVSAIHGHGTGDLLDAVCANIDFNDGSSINNDIYKEDLSIKVAIVGRPNAGKSSLINKIINKDRSIVSDVPGTTRDSIDVSFKNEVGFYTLIDTAGIRKRKKIEDDIERYSVIRAKNAIDRSDVCLLMVDISSGYAEQDSKIVEYVENAGKGLIILANKWDSVPKDSYTMQSYKEELVNNFSFAKYAQILFISAKTGQRVTDIFPLLNEVYKACNFRISTGTLNNFLSKIMAKVPPPTHKGKRLKIFYCTEPSIAPPTFVFFVNSKKLFHFSYQRYIENQLRECFTLKGTPIRFIVREKEHSDFKV